MVDVALSIFLIGTLLCEVALVVLFYRAVYNPPAIWREMFDAWSERRVAPVDSKSTGHNEIGSRSASGVEDLPPEIIAPSLKNPPRPKGGFGSRVGEVDDSS